METLANVSNFLTLLILNCLVIGFFILDKKIKNLESKDKK